MKLFKFFKKNKSLNATILRAYRREAYVRLMFDGSWSGYWVTVIDGVRYRSERVSGFKYIIGDYNNFIRNSILDRIRLRKNKENAHEIYDMINYGTERYIDSNGNGEWW